VSTTSTATWSSGRSIRSRNAISLAKAALPGLDVESEIATSEGIVEPRAEDAQGRSLTEGLTGRLPDGRMGLETHDRILNRSAAAGKVRPPAGCAPAGRLHDSRDSVGSARNRR